MINPRNGTSPNSREEKKYTPCVPQPRTVQKANHLCARHLVTPLVEGIQQQFREVAPRPKVLDVPAKPHARNAARNAVVAAEQGPHQHVALVLNAGGVDRDLRAVMPEGLWQPGVPQYRYVGLWRRSWHQ